MHRLAGKYVIWLSTYWVHRSSKYLQCNGINRFSLIHDASVARELDEFLRKMHIVLILKAHHAQDLSIIREKGLSNVVLLSNDFFLRTMFLHTSFMVPVARS